MGYVILPSASVTPFVALTPARTQGLVQVYDLRTMKAVGRPLRGRFDLFGDSPAALSADGSRFAARIKGAARPTVEVWNVATGRSLARLEIDTDPKFVPGAIDFLGGDRLLVVKQEGLHPGTGQKTTYQTWDLKTGKVVSQFDHNLVFHPKWGALSPGRRYLVMEQTGTRTGYHLLFWDLAAGELAGDLEFQGRLAPFGQAAAIAFSPDGEQVAMLWRLGQRPDCWGRLLCWDVRTGKKVHDHKIGYALEAIDSIWADWGGARTLQWIPDKSGWMLFGHLLIDRRSGAVVGKVGPEPNSIGVQDRRFLDSKHVTGYSDSPFEKRIGIIRIQR
jgi:WD40 repeat protein